MFAATGVTKGYLLDGVRFFGDEREDRVDRHAHRSPARSA